MTAPTPSGLINWGYTDRASAGERRCRKCRALREVVVWEKEGDTLFYDEVMCVACGFTWDDYGGWSLRTWCRPKPGHEADYDGNPHPDPAWVQRPEPMTDEAAAWVREHVLTPGLRVVRSLCRCAEPAVLCGDCAGNATAPRHGVTNGVEITPETWLYNIHGNPWGAGWGGRTIRVWLADRTCRRVCPCDCHTVPAVAFEQDALFEVIA